MKLVTTRATSHARRSLSLRARLLAGLIVLTTTFLVVMGVVTTIVLGTLERDQLNAEVGLAASQSVSSMAAGTGGFSAAYLSLDSGATGILTPDSVTADTLLAEASSLKGLSSTQVSAKLQRLSHYARPFNLTIKGQPTVRAAWRYVPSKATASAASSRLRSMPTAKS